MKDAAQRKWEEMKDASQLMQLIQPKDIDTSNRLLDTFGKQEREIAARWIVRFCQERELGWAPFTYREINEFYKSKGFKDDFRMNGLHEYGIVPDGDPQNAAYTIHYEFVSRCCESSPMACEICGHETPILDYGTGAYAEKLVCGLCDSRNFTEKSLRLDIKSLAGELAETAHQSSVVQKRLQNTVEHYAEMIEELEKKLKAAQEENFSLKAAKAALEVLAARRM